MRFSTSRSCSSDCITRARSSEADAPARKHGTSASARATGDSDRGTARNADKNASRRAKAKATAEKTAARCKRTRTQRRTVKRKSTREQERDAGQPHAHHTNDGERKAHAKRAAFGGGLDAFQRRRVRVPAVCARPRHTHRSIRRTAPRRVASSDRSNERHCARKTPRTVELFLVMTLIGAAAAAAAAAACARCRGHDGGTERGHIYLRFSPRNFSIIFVCRACPLASTSSPSPAPPPSALGPSRLWPVKGRRAVQSDRRANRLQETIEAQAERR